MRWNGFLGTVVASILAGWCAPATAGPITFNTALNAPFVQAFIYEVLRKRGLRT